MCHINTGGTLKRGVIANLGRQVGIRESHQSVRIIVGMDGKVINAFPVRMR